MRERINELQRQAETQRTAALEKDSRSQRATRTKHQDIEGCKS